MAFSQGKQPDSKATEQPLISKNQRDIDTSQMFQLIDSMVSFEACLYHQVLPLALEESRLKLGMVNPEDPNALDYVGRILSYMNCSLVSQPIGRDAHQALLSAYLNYREHPPSPQRNRTAAHEGGAKSALEPERSRSSDPPAPKQVAAERVGKAPARANPNDQPTLILADIKAPKSLETDRANSQIPLPPLTVPRSNSSLPVLEVHCPHLSSPIQKLATLQPKNLLQELLGRVLLGGIGRLYFQRQFPSFGRIIWSQNGVVQSTLEELPLPVLQEAIDELKRLTHLPLSPVQETKQVEIERLYQQDRLLLRLRVIPGAHGEEATLQVLRGSTLR